MNKLLKFLISILLYIGVLTVSGCDKLKNRVIADTDTGKKNLYEELGFNVIDESLKPSVFIFFRFITNYKEYMIIDSISNYGYEFNFPGILI